MIKANVASFLGALFLLTAQPLDVLAADIRPYIFGSGSYREIVIEGNIERGDFDTFIRIVRENEAQIDGVECFSPGGDFDEAMKIGRAMRALELHSQAPMRNSAGKPVCDGPFGTPKDDRNCTCASAGFFIHIGATHRGGTFLAVHRPFFERGKFGTLSEAEARRAFDKLQETAREYMHDMGVPPHVQEDILGTPSDKSLVLDEKIIKMYFWGDLPYRHEWIRNKCSRLSDTERERADSYNRRMTSSSKGGLSKSEKVDFDDLLKAQDGERACAIQITQQSRTVAYERFFHETPTDFERHNVSKWAEAARYLGKSFYELMSEENFDEDKRFGQVSLQRNATASAPMIILFDSPSRLRVVESIALASTPKPSPEFIKRLVKSLSLRGGGRWAAMERQIGAGIQNNFRQS